MEHENTREFAEPIIVDREKFEAKKARIAEAGADKFYVLSDFDRTLTTAHVDGKPFPSLISILRNENYLTPDYPEKARALYDHYAPMERDINLTLEARKELMEEWWRKHFELLIQSKLNRADINRAIKSSGLRLRNGVKNFINTLKQNNIPLVILSSAGLGVEAIEAALKEKGCHDDNIKIVGNSFVYNNNGDVVAVAEPIIHTLNKDEAELAGNDKTAEIVKNKSNVIVLGDSPSDANMADGLNHDTILKIGFLNEHDENNLRQYKEIFDVLILNDGKFDFINQTLNNMI